MLLHEKQLFISIIKNQYILYMKLKENDIKYIIKTACSLLKEDVFADKNKINKKNKTIGLTYNRAGRNYGNARKTDMLKTDKMDAQNSDTYEVILKGGITSYNITDIKGTEVMHFFKRYYDNLKTEIKIDDGDVTELYKILMEKNDFNEFMETFKNKIEFVVKHYIAKNNIDISELKGISIFPIESSSRFNDYMAKFLTYMQVNNLPIQLISKNMLVKDLRNFEADKDFIKKNKDFYNSSYTEKENPEYGTVQNQVDTALNRYHALKNLPTFINNANFYFGKIMSIYGNRNREDDSISDKRLRTLADYFMAYYDNLHSCLALSYTDTVTNQEKHFMKKTILVQKKYSKGPSIDDRSKRIWNMVKPLIGNEISTVTGKPYKIYDICGWEPKKFEIKKLKDSVRMGVRNIYNPNEDHEMVRQEIEKTNNTIFIIFDDNISGGATLGDICYQCKELGIKNLCPITFGKMDKAETIGTIKLNKPKDGWNM